MAKIIFVNPPFTRYGGLKGHGGKSMPLNLCYLASYVRQKLPQHEYKILDAEAECMTYEQIEDWMEKEIPDIVGISLSTAAYEHCIHVLQSVKRVNPNAMTFAGGPHPTAMPEECVKEECLDFAVISEGEITCYELIRSWLKKEKNFSNIKGIAYINKNKYVRTESREFLSNLDELPFPARDLAPLHLYAPSPTKRVSSGKSTSILGERGCPHDCHYCVSPRFWKRTYRARSPKNIVDEIQECVEKYGISEFNFHDDLFTLKKQRIMDFCKEIDNRNLKIIFTIQSRVDTLDSEMLQMLAEAGCKKISFGFESGSQEILDNVKKRATIEQARKAVKMVNAAGIYSSGSFMIGNIGETTETIKKTIDFAKDLNLDTVAFQVTTPLPGTELYDIATEKGYIRNGIKLSDFVTVSKKLPVMNLPNLSSEDLLKWRKIAYRKFYMRPRYILKKLKQVNTRGSFKNIFEGLKLFIRVSS